jgi:hypothetical protein
MRHSLFRLDTDEQARDRFPLTARRGSIQARHIRAKRNSRDFRFA